MPTPFGALRVRNFRLHFTGQVASNVGTWFHTLAQALLVIELTHSGKALGLCTALQFAPTLVLGPYAGVLADRWRPRALLLTTASIAFVIAASLAAVTAAGKIDVRWIYGVALALGCLNAFERPAAQAFLYELVGPQDLPKAIGLHSITQSSARMIGPALGGAAYALFGSATCFAINALSFLWAIAALLAMRPAELWPRSAAASAGAGQVWQGMRYALDHAELRAPLLVNALIGALAFNFMITVTAMVRLTLGGGASAAGAAHALNAAGAVLGSLLIASLERPPSRSALALACCGVALTTGVNALAPSLLSFLLWAPFFGFSVGAYQTSLLSSVQHATEPRMLGRVSALLTLGSVGMTPIASLIAGALIDRWSVRVAMGLGATACMAGALMLARLPRPAADRSAA